MDGYTLGAITAIATSLCWTVSAVAFERAGKTFGSMALNVVRLALALVLFAIYNASFSLAILPIHADLHAWTWLGLSALVGLVFGDYCLFYALILIGPRRSLLMMATAPAWTVLLSWIFFDEVLSWVHLGGIAMISAGVMLAIVSRRKRLPTADASHGPETRKGLILAMGGAIGQAGGFLLSKEGMGELNPFEATQVRVIVALAAFVALAFLGSTWQRIRTGFGDRAAVIAATLGAFAGPFLGVSLSLLALRLTYAGVASSLLATTPLWLTLVARLRGEKVGWRGMVGAVLAVAGVALLFLPSLAK